MKADHMPGSAGGPEREDLRSFLRHWRVTGPPPDIEEGLRRAFRRRRPDRRRIVWLSLAAGLALAALSQLVPTGPPVPTERPVVVGSPRPAPPAPRGAAPVEPRAGETPAALASPARVRRPPAAPVTERDVMVEPGQAELLVELGRKLWTVRQAAPGTTMPRIETVPADAPETPIPQMRATDAPPYRATWETVAGEWPFIHRSIPGSGR